MPNTKEKKAEKQRISEEIKGLNERRKQLRTHLESYEQKIYEAGIRLAEKRKQSESFKPKDRSLKLPHGTFSLASTFKLQPSDHFFLLETVNTIIHRFQLSHSSAIFCLVNLAMIMRLFGTVGRAFDYGTAKFMVSDGVQDNTIIVIAHTYSP